MKLVILESPFAGDVKFNEMYARACLRDSLLRGESPIASHLLYTQPGVLDDDIPDERMMGIDAGLSWRSVATGSVVYMDLGVTPGMQYGINKMVSEDKPVIFRHLDPQTMKELLNDRHNPYRKPD